jgi:hypothetical protein
VSRLTVKAWWMVVIVGAVARTQRRGPRNKGGAVTGATGRGSESIPAPGPETETEEEATGETGIVIVEVIVEVIAEVIGGTAAGIGIGTETATADATETAGKRTGRNEQAYTGAVQTTALCLCTARGEGQTSGRNAACGRAKRQRPRHNKSQEAQTQGPASTHPTFFFYNSQCHCALEGRSDE